MIAEMTLPFWQLELNRWMKRLGPRCLLGGFCIAVAILAMSLSQLLISLLGFGDRGQVAIAVGLCALVLGGAMGSLCLRLIMAAEQAQQQLHRFSQTDLLTGAANRRFFLNLIEREWALARRYETTCALVLLDVDHFKRVNDGFGHHCGDVLLRQIAEACSETLRQGDVLSRFGGGEFILFLPHTDPLGALDVAERIRERVEHLDFGWNGHCIPVSVSLGVAALQAEHVALGQFVKAAEQALLAAKASGRNCVRVGENEAIGRDTGPGRAQALG